MRFLFSAPCLGLVLLSSFLPHSAQAGGSLQSVDFTNAQPSPIAGELLVTLAPIRRDARCIPTPYSVNTIFDPIPSPIPNPPGGPVVSIGDAAVALQAAFDRWNQIRTSFIDLQVTSTVETASPPAFDTINELTFIAPPGFKRAGLIAASVATTLPADVFFADGTDLDFDGDSDVSNAIETCADVDLDGDLEIPAGDYASGTLLDNDIYFDASAIRFTNRDQDLDSNSQSVDLLAVATHEAGHAHGLAHAMDNQRSRFDGTQTTMYINIDSTDPRDQLGVRSLATDDMAYSSFFYPEGTAAEGPGALQPGDLAFRKVYGLIAGTVTSGITGNPIAGASVSAINLFTGRTASAAYSGRVQLFVTLADGSIRPAQGQASVLDGNYEIPLPFGFYKLAIEAPDNAPGIAEEINTTVTVGRMLGQLNFKEEFFDAGREAAIEESPGAASLVISFPGHRFPGFDFVTNRQEEISGFGAFSKTVFPNPPPGRYLAVRIPGEEILAVDQGNGLALQSADFFTFPQKRADVALFSRALLTSGSITGTQVTIDLKRPLESTRWFAGQDGDFTPFYFRRPKLLGKRVLHKLRLGLIEDLFLVLRLPIWTPFPTASGLAPTVGVSQGANRAMSYISDDGKNWSRVTEFDFMFRLVMTPL